MTPSFRRLDRRRPNLSPVLRIRAIGEPDAIIAVADQVGKGRLFAMSDPSAAINQMLHYPGNRAFMAGLARYLVDDDGRQRHQGRLFIVANKFGEEGSCGGKTSLRKDFESQLKALANALAAARREGFPGWTHILLAALAAVSIAIWVVRASARAYRSPLPRYARAVPSSRRGASPGGRGATTATASSPERRGRPAGGGRGRWRSSKASTATASRATPDGQHRKPPAIREERLRTGEAPETTYP